MRFAHRRAAQRPIPVAMRTSVAFLALLTSAPSQDDARGEMPTDAAATLEPVTAVATRGQHSTSLATPVVRVPFDSSVRYVAVDVLIDGTGPYRFNVDTGASLAGAIDVTLAHRLGLREVGRARNTDGTGAVVDRPIVRADSLVVGHAEFRAVRLLVEDFEWVSPAGSPPTNGLLGFPLFAELLLTIDYPRRELVLRSGSLPTEPSATTLGFELDAGVPAIELGIGADRFAAIVDTGNPTALTLPHSFRKLVSTKLPPRIVAHGRSAYHSFAYLGAPLAAPLRLAGTTFDDVGVMFAPAFDAPLLGYELLRHFAVTFDQVSRRIRFESPVVVAATGHGSRDRQERESGGHDDGR